MVMYNIGACHIYTDKYAGLSVCIMCSVSFSHSEKKPRCYDIMNFDINFNI